MAAFNKMVGGSNVLRCPPQPLTAEDYEPADNSQESDWLRKVKSKVISQPLPSSPPPSSFFSFFLGGEFVLIRCSEMRFIFLKNKPHQNRKDFSAWLAQAEGTDMLTFNRRHTLNLASRMITRFKFGKPMILLIGMSAI
jgi:hypothetical protein